MAQSGISEKNPIYSFISSQHVSLNLLLLTMALVGTILMFGFGIWLSNKVAGPIYRMTMDLNKLDPNKEQKNIHFRDGDFFFELKDALNSYLERSHHSKKNKNKDDNAA